MDNTAAPAPAPLHPLTTFQRVVRFPLVALVLGLLVFAVLMAAVFGVLGVVAAVAGVAENDTPPAWLADYVLSILLTVGSVLLLKIAVRHLGEEPRDDLPFDARSRDFGWGILFAGLLMSAIVGVTALLGGYRIDGWGGSTSLAFIILSAGFQAAFFEEILFRGVIFRFVEAFAGSWVALLVSALLFGLVHWSNPNGTLLAALAIAIEAGVLLGGAYMLTRNLWLAIGLHWGWNVVQAYIWDVAVSGIAVDGMLDARPAGDPLISGGSFGLESSVVAMVLATGTGLWLVWMAAQRGHVVQPWWVRRRRGLSLPASSAPLAPMQAKPVQA
ncbi:CPBP family intramembrane metalloprotease [Erythrobacter arachoides]|uniref:CPBP family intramembrane metalloprotease n=1 Tax=Aurantiacibacter arachoides TaxID=1850444 RepID=A0A845A042_9SPHN|nr:type II CAAX endopeptidase family protein [Aurantiacibacter arachoides]MXO93515.1 CPBP family intramembrane metalloprotease [Aurantiacibacter arachoides]